MKHLLALLALMVAAATTHAATYYVPAPFPMQGKTCLIKFGANVMVNLGSVTVFRFYDKNSDPFNDSWKGNTVLFVGTSATQVVQGNALDAIEKRIEECNK